MGDMKLNLEAEKAGTEIKAEKARAGERPNWETPKLEDVSEQVMAQPYIRFT